MHGFKGNRSYLIILQLSVSLPFAVALTLPYPNQSMEGWKLPWEDTQKWVKLWPAEWKTGQSLRMP